MPLKLALLLAITLAGCKKLTSASPTEVTDPAAVDIASFATTPSDQFILDSAGLAKVSRAFPFKGTASSCAHQGAHLNFTNSGAPYTVDIISPVAGTVGRVDTCYMLSGSDRYGLSILFAESAGKRVSFDFSIEPQGGYLCSGGVSGQDNGFYNTYLLKAEGDVVAKGEVIARMYKSNSGDDAAHIHFDLNYESRGFACPNIFNTAIETTFAGLFNGESCSGTPYPATFCYLPGAGEDLTGL